MMSALYQQLLVRFWPAYTGALFLVIISLFLMINGQFWGIFGGLLLWGDYLNYLLGLGELLGIDHPPESPLYHSTSLTNLCLIAGALSSALLAGQFGFHRSPPAEYLRAVFGGILMGLGAVLAGGCTIGGFFTPLLFSSAAGWAMCVGLAIGAGLGMKLLSLSLARFNWGTTPPITRNTTEKVKHYHPLLGLLLILLVLGWALLWQLSSDPSLNTRALFIITGLALGLVLQRSRFCLSQVFHGPFLGIGSEMSHALIKALALGIPLAAIILKTRAIDAYQVIPATFWLGSFTGGTLFGIGMISAGGCASGTLWRAGEGHLKLWLTLFIFSWSGSIFRGLLKQSGVLGTDIDIHFLDGSAEISQLGFQAYLPDLLNGWEATLTVTYLGLLAAWWLCRNR